MVSSKLVAAVGAVIGTLPALADVYPIVLNAYSPMITYKGSWNQSTNEPYNAGAYSTINERYVLGVGGCCNWPTIQYSFIGTKLLFNGYWGSPGDIELTIDGGTASKVATPDNWTKGSGPATIVTASLSSGYHSVNYQVNSGFMDIYSLTAFTEFSGVSSSALSSAEAAAASWDSSSVIPTYSGGGVSSSVQTSGSWTGSSTLGSMGYAHIFGGNGAQVGANLGAGNAFLRINGSIGTDGTAYVVQVTPPPPNTSNGGSYSYSSYASWTTTLGPLFMVVLDPSVSYTVVIANTGGGTLRVQLFEVWRVIKQTSTAAAVATTQSTAAATTTRTTTGTSAAAGGGGSAATQSGSGSASTTMIPTVISVPSLTTMVVNGQTTVSTMMVQSTSLMRVAVSGGVTVALDAAATGSGGAGGTTEPPTSTKLVSGTVPPGASVSAYTSVDSHGSTVVIQTIVTSVPNSTAPEGDKSNLGAIIGGVVGGILALLLLVALIWYLRRRRRIAAYDRSNIDPYPEYEDNLSEAPMSTVEGDDYVATAQVHRAHLSQTSFQGYPEAALASSTLDPTSPPPKAMYTRGFGSAASTAGAAGVGAGAVAGTSRLGTVPEQSPSQNQYMVGAANGRNELVTQERDAGMLFAAASSGPSSPMRERIIPPSYDPAWSSSSPPLPEKGGFVPRPPSESPTDSYSSPGSPDTRASAGTYRHPFF